MNHTTHPLARLAALATTVLGLVLVSAGHAAARNLPGDPSGPGGTYDGPGTASVQPPTLTDGSMSALQWVLFAAAVLAALVIGAALTHIAERHRVAIAH